MGLLGKTCLPALLALLGRGKAKTPFFDLWFLSSSLCFASSLELVRPHFVPQTWKRDGAQSQRERGLSRIQDRAFLRSCLKRNEPA